MNGVLEIIHVLMVCCDIEDGSDWLCQLDWELAGVGTKLDWRIQAASVTGIVVLVSLVQTQEHGSLVVIHHVNADVDVRLIAIVDPPDGVVTMQLSGMDIELQMMVGELETRQRQDHCLHDTISTGLDQIVTTILLQVEQPIGDHSIHPGEGV